jgi:phenylpyruvate tautomerase PptA (4-oxalocrotonate tautomerase family)
MPWYGAKIQLQLDENVWLVMDDQKQAIIQELSRQLQIILSCRPYHTTVSF